MKIAKVTDPNMKSEICKSVLRALPRWFGIESAIVDYVSDVRRMETWAVFEQDAAIGFASINKHFPGAAEIHVMGVLERFHRHGVGSELLKQIEADLSAQGIKFLTVKTLSESRVDEAYKQTRNFYLKSGFFPLEEFKTLWGEGNPCLFMVKGL